MIYQLSKNTSLYIAGLGSTCLAAALGLTLATAPPALAGRNTDLSPFSNNIVATNGQGSKIDTGYAQIPGCGSMRINRDALQQVSWFKSRRQVSIEDDSPIVTNRQGSGGGAMVAPGALSPAGFGTNTGGGSYATPHLSQANLGGLAKQEQARPIMHSAPTGAQAKAYPLSPGNAAPPPRPRPVAPAASYRSYGNQPVAAVVDSEAVHMRTVKARLLGAGGN